MSAKIIIGVHTYTHMHTGSDKPGLDSGLDSMNLNKLFAARITCTWLTSYCLVIAGLASYSECRDSLNSRLTLQRILATNARPRSRLISCYNYYFLTLVHHLIILLSLLIVAMRGRRDVSMSSVFVRMSMAILHRLFLPPQGEWVMLLAKYTRDWPIY